MDKILLSSEEFEKKSGTTLNQNLNGNPQRKFQQNNKNGVSTNNSKTFTKVKNNNAQKNNEKKSEQKSFNTAKPGSNDRNKFNNAKKDPVQKQKHNSHENKETKPLKVMFLGGVGEIGKNLTVLEYENDIIVIDCGLSFPSDDMLGIDLVVPDLTYLINNKEKVRGFLITHAHEDHIGALPYALRDINAPIYGSNMTLGFISRKMEEHKKIQYKTYNVKPGEIYSLGVFSVEFIHTNHSIPGSFALGIKTPVGNVVATGDFKFEFSTHEPVINLNKFAEYGSKGTLLLLSDSTNANMPGYSLSEGEVARTIDQLFAENKGKRIIIAAFASNLRRIEYIMSIAEKHKRKVVLTGRSMINNVDVAAKIGELKINRQNLIEVDKVASYKGEELCIFSTGSQGEPMSALSRMSTGDFKGIQIGSEDTIIFSSSTIPGNEKDISNTINSLMLLGAKIIYNQQIANVHASGHAKQEELKIILSLVKPKYLVPVHGEQVHLVAHKDLAMNMGMNERNIKVPMLGMKLEFTENSMKVAGTVPFGERLIDGNGVGEMDSNVLKERKQLSEDGLCIVILNASPSLGRLAARPEIMSRGFTYQGEAGVWLDEAKDNIIASCENIDFKNRDYVALKTAVKKGLTNYLMKKLKRKPVIIPIIVES